MQANGLEIRLEPRAQNLYSVKAVLENKVGDVIIMRAIGFLLALVASCCSVVRFVLARSVQTTLNPKP